MSNSLIPFGTRYPEVFDEFQRGMDAIMGRLFAREGGDGSDWFNPPANVSESADKYEVSMDLPGVSPENVSVELKQGDLWVTGERHHEEEQKDKKFHRVERYQGRFQRVIRLGDDVNADKVDAEYRNGVLHISVPKCEAAKPKKIQIRS